MIQDTQCTYNAIIRLVRETIVAVEKEKLLNTLTVCVCVALVIQGTKIIRIVKLSSVAFLALQYFSALCNKRHDFRNRVIGHKMRVSVFFTIFV